MNQLLEELIEIAPLYAKSLQQEAAIAISDLNEYVALFETETLKYPFPVGTKIEEAGYKSVLEKVVLSGKPVVDYVSKEITGTVPIKSIIAPVYDDGELVGCMSLSINMEKETQMDNFLALLKMPIESANQKISRERIDAGELVSLVDSVQNQMQQIEERMRKGAEVLMPLQKLVAQMEGETLNQVLQHPKTSIYEKEIARAIADLYKLEKQCEVAFEEINKWVDNVEGTCGTLFHYIE